MPDYRFERECRTASSEAYSIWEDDRGVGRVDLHFTTAAAHATLCVGQEFSEDEIQELIGAVDEELVMTSDPYREDLVVTVWAGKEVGVYSDEEEGEYEEGEEEEEEEEGPEGNGHRP